MEEGLRPIFCRESQAVQERRGLDGKFVIIDLRGAVLWGTGGAGGFDCITEVAEEKIPEVWAFSKFATLVWTYAAAIGVAMLC